MANCIVSISKVAVILLSLSMVSSNQTNYWTISQASSMEEIKYDTATFGTGCFGVLMPYSAN